MVILEGLGLNVNARTTRGKAAYTIFFQDTMEAISAGGTCLFTSYAMLPGPILTNPNNSLVQFINRMIPALGGMIGFTHNHSWLLGFNMADVLAHPYLLKLVTGYKMNLGRFVTLGERGYNLERLINIRQGLKASDDVLPRRLTAELQRADDPDSKVKLAGMIMDYYRIRGWDKEGVPTKARLQKLGLGGYSQ